MKTYTKEEYIAAYPGGVLITALKNNSKFKPFRWLPDTTKAGCRTFCSCRRGGRLNRPVYGFYEDCPNCNGKGRMPIPLEELI
jgi:hypothetical protein